MHAFLSLGCAWICWPSERKGAATSRAERPAGGDVVKRLLHVRPLSNNQTSHHVIPLTASAIEAVAPVDRSEQLAEEHEAVRIRDRQGPDQDVIRDADDRRDSSDRHGENEHDRHRQPTAAAHVPGCRLEICRECDRTG